MFVLSDGKKWGFNPLYPIIPLPFAYLNLFDRERVLLLMPYYVLVDLIALGAASLVLFTEISLPNNFPVFLSGGLIAYICTRVFLRKHIRIPKNAMRIVGVAPKIVWIEHILVCMAFSLIELVSAKISHLPLLGDNIWSIFAYMGFFAAVFPFINYFYAAKMKSMGLE